MILLNFFIMISILSAIMPGMFSFSDYDVYIAPLYESETEIYFEVSEYGWDYYDTSYSVAILDKETGEFTANEYSKNTDLRNYLTGTYYKNSLELNNPIFYNFYSDEFIDIRNQQVLDISEECYYTSKYNDKCNILDNDIQIVLNYAGSDTFELVLTDYVNNVELTTYSFTEYSTERNIYTSISSYTKYDDNKVGIKVDFYTKDPNDYYVEYDYYIESIVFEYTIDTNTMVELFRGPEYNLFNFNIVDNCYVFSNFVSYYAIENNYIYKYDIETSTLTSTTNDHYSSYIGNGYWYGWLDSGRSIYRYNSDLEIESLYNKDYDNWNSIPYVFSNGYLYLEKYVSGYWNSSLFYSLTDINTGDIIFEFDRNNKTSITEYYESNNTDLV